MKHLIVNADDFGYSYGINKGIIEAHKTGIVTSTSLMVYGISADQAGSLAEYKDLSLGLHLDLQRNRGLSIKQELKEQTDMFLSLTGKQPDHLDFHKYEPTGQEVKDYLLDYLAELNISARKISAKSIKSFFGGQLASVSGSSQTNDLSIQGLKLVLDEVTDKYNELMCHVGYSDDYLCANSSYTVQREQELRTICHPDIKDYLLEKEIQLISWKQVPVLSS